MKSLFKIASAAVLAAAVAAGSAEAQVRIQPIQPYGGVQRPVLPPTILLIKPSQALRIAMRAVPNAKPLGVQLRGNRYIVKLKQGNAIRLLAIGATDGSIQ